MSSSIGLYITSFASYGQLAAYAMFYALSAVVLYTLVSRFFVKGMSGGLKG